MDYLIAQQKIILGTPDYVLCESISVFMLFEFSKNS